METQFQLQPHDQEVLDVLKQALDFGLTVSFSYDGQPRLVEVHALGATTTGRPALRGFQTEGGSNSEDPPMWRLFTLRKIQDLRLLDFHSSAPREGYRKGDKGMSTIFYEFPTEGL